MIAAIWSAITGSRVVRWVAIGLAALAAVWAYGAGQRRRGREDARADAAHQALRNMEVRRDVEDAIRRSGDGTAADRLRERWARD